ncbi:MAG: DUF4276 family protein [Gammaproteobacteria bacterium]|nr:DUF4276 family protein [Gammaproteobacteria bacterium]
MNKHVVVVASGETERRALPHLLAHLKDEGVFAEDVRIPPRNGSLNVQMAEKLIKAAWYEDVGSPPDKIIVLVDVDARAPPGVLRPFEQDLPSRLGADISARVLCAYAQWHLEAWYFGDTANLRDYLGGSVGSVDTSKPDEIENPKRHLKQILGHRVYTARVSEEIASALHGPTIADRSPSFRGLVNATLNGST